MYSGHSSTRSSADRRVSWHSSTPPSEISMDISRGPRSRSKSRAGEIAAKKKPTMRRLSLKETIAVSDAKRAEEEHVRLRAEAKKKKKQDEYNRKLAATAGFQAVLEVEGRTRSKSKNSTALERARAELANCRQMKKIFEFEAQTRAERQEAAAKFRSLDEDGGGTLDLEEFLKGAHLYSLTRSEARKLFAELDEDQSGELDIEDFLDHMEHQAKVNETKELAKLFKFESGKEIWAEATRKFRALDEDGSGTLDLEEFLKGAHLYNLDEAAARKWFIELDESGNGNIDIDYFLSRMKKEAERVNESDLKLKRIFDFEGQTEEEQEAAAAKFRALDVDGSGTLDFEEFFKGAQNYRLTEEAALAIFKELDETESGEIHIEDFLARVRGAVQVDQESPVNENAANMQGKGDIKPHAPVRQPQRTQRARSAPSSPNGTSLDGPVRLRTVALSGTVARGPEANPFLPPRPPPQPRFEVDPETRRRFKEAQAANARMLAVAKSRRLSAPKPFF